MLGALAQCVGVAGCRENTPNPAPAGSTPLPLEAASPRADKATRAQPPNVLLYIVDTLRADSLGCYGHPVVQTPAINRLAAEGVLFERCYAQSSWTRASIGAILTGRYPESHGAEGRDDELSDGVTTLAEALKSRGFATCALVANPNIGSFYGFQQGFDTYAELYERQQPGFVAPGELITSSDVITRRAIDWLRDAPQPWFLMILSIDPHTPYRPRPEFDRYAPQGQTAGPIDGVSSVLNRADISDAEKERARSLYWAEISFNDSSLGELLTYVDTASLRDRTVVALTSDHGEEFWEHGKHGHGRTLYQEVLHVPLIIRAPGAMPAGRSDPRVARLIDLAPTLLSLTATDLPTGLAGRSLLDQAGPEAPLVYSSIRMSRRDGQVREIESLRQGRWKLIHDLTAKSRELFDLDADPLEQKNLAAARKADLSTLKTSLAAIRDASRRERPSNGVSSSSRPARTRSQSERARNALEKMGYMDDD